VKYRAKGKDDFLLIEKSENTRYWKLEAGATLGNELGNEEVDFDTHSEPNADEREITRFLQFMGNLFQLEKDQWGSLSEICLKIKQLQ
jgi:hypothetical protein